MKLHDPALMAALMDGELKGWRLRYVQRHIAKCPICAVEYRQQLHVHRLLKDNPPGYTMSGSPDFFWSKVRGEIQERGREEAGNAESRLSLAEWMWQRRRVLATATAVVVPLVVAIGLLRVGPGTRSSVASPRPPANAAQVSHAIPNPPTVAIVPQGMVVEVNSPVPDTAATSFHSDDADATVIWVSGLPWTPDMTEMMTVYASLGT